MELTPSQLKLVVHYAEKAKIDVAMAVDRVEGEQVTIAELGQGILGVKLD